MSIFKISIWLRIIRIKFLLSSLLAVILGLVLNYYHNNFINIIQFLLTLSGVISLHISVDLLNDYWDFKRGIDIKTHKTKFSGGTGILPSRLLKPSNVYFVGMFFLLIGILIGTYFVYYHGFVILLMLIFATISIYFYSTKIVDHGLAEIFVCIKGTMIVLGTYFIQNNDTNIEIMIIGINIGLLSSLVLFIASFPDFEADKSHGRKTILAICGKKNSTLVYWIFPTMIYCITAFEIFFGYLPYSCLAVFFVLPLVINSGILLNKNYNNIRILEVIIGQIILFSRLYVILLIFSLIFDFIFV
ncbi:MAG: prenyltransferase [Thaumarchaeota archaeon]|nr:prenyltransferase [Nitrososphaerota archaeon]